MITSENGLNLIKQSEQLRLKPYLCPAKDWTVGWGHRIQEGEHFTEITEQEAEELLRKDAAIAENCIHRSVKVPLTQNQFDALVSFIYNVGCFAFLHSTMLKELNNAR